MFLNHSYVPLTNRSVPMSGSCMKPIDVILDTESSSGTTISWKCQHFPEDIKMFVLFGIYNWVLPSFQNGTPNVGLCKRQYAVTQSFLNVVIQWAAIMKPCSFCQMFFFILLKQRYIKITYILQYFRAAVNNLPYPLKRSFVQ